MFKRLKQKLAKPSAPVNEKPEDTADAPHKDNSPKTNDFGLLSVIESKPDPEGKRDFPVDIIAVHGLGGKAFSTWKHSNGTFWLEDLLPHDLPGSRIFTYGYPGSAFYNSSYATVHDYAHRLLGDIRSVRSELDDYRPIIFVCHSMGGIVCKQALVSAHENNAFYGDILRSVGGIVFLATPHGGSGLASVGTVVSNLLKGFPVGRGVIKHDLVETLASSSGPLTKLAGLVRDHLKDLRIVSFYETEPLPIKLGKHLIVSRESATIGVPQERTIPLYADHKSICRFEGRTSNYVSVSRALCDIAEYALGAIKFHEADEICVSLFVPFDIADYCTTLPKPIEGTCQWILKHPEFKSWREDPQRAILWVNGDPGCGKTMHTVSIVQYLSSSQKYMPAEVYAYFCDDKVNKQRNSQGILMGLIYQMVDRHRTMVRHVRRVYDLHGSSMAQSFALLWGVFKSIVNSIKNRSVYIVIDALDECEKETRALILTAIYDMSAIQGDGAPNEPLVKFFLTSRPGVDRPALRESQSEHEIQINESQPGYVEELQAYIQQRVDHICLERGFNSTSRDMLLTRLTAKADQTFLWIHMVLELLESSGLASAKELQELVDELPPGLSATYSRFVSSIPHSHHAVAARLLKLLLASSRPLKLEEINIAFTINSSHSSTEDLAEECQASIAHTLRLVLGPMIRMSEDRVSLVHQSAKDFLLRNQEVGRFVPDLADANTGSSAVPMANACIHYLLLDNFQRDMFFTDDTSIGLDSESFSSGDDSSTGDMDFMFFDQEKMEEDKLGEHWHRGRPGTFDTDKCRTVAIHYSFYSYAALNWAESFAACESFASADLKKNARMLLDANSAACRNWFHFYLASNMHAADTIPNTLDAVMLAAYLGLSETLQGLLEEEVSQEMKNQALFWAARNGHSRAISLLLAAGGDPNTRHLDVQTPLTIAAKYGHLECVSILLAHEPTDRYMRGSGGRDVLSFACSQGHFQMVKEILKQKDSKADEPDRTGATPLFYAAENQHLSIVAHLIRYAKVNINHRDKTGRTVLSWMAGNGLKDVLEYLLKLKEIDINLGDDKGMTPLLWAVRQGQTEIVSALLGRKRTDKAVLDRDKRGAISWACGEGHPEVLQILLDHGCPGVDDLDIDNWTPLAWAIQKNVPENIRILASTGAVNLNRQDRPGRTALHWAVEYGHILVVQQLLEEGADPRIPSASRRTPMDVAVSFKRQDILEVLSQRVEALREE